jgi:hypothetical protein
MSLGRTYASAAADVDRGLRELVGRDVPAPPVLVLVPGIGRTILKVRVASSDMKRGKSGGFRVLLDHRGGEAWAPILAYAKPEREDVTRAEILRAALGELP